MFSTQLKRATVLLRRGSWRRVLRAVRRRLYSETVSYGLVRDLARPLEPRSARVPLSIRPLRASDVPDLLDMKAPGLSGDEVFQRQHQLELVQLEIPTCYVAVTQDDRPCYMQWLIYATENPTIREAFHGHIPPLAPDEVLLEGAYTPEAHRGQGIMALAMARIAEQAAPMGARRAITFVLVDNIPSLKGCYRAGFFPSLVRRNRWRLFRSHTTFSPLAPDAAPGIT